MLKLSANLRLMSLIYYHVKMNKAVYTDTPVACGLAGAIFKLLEHLASSSLMIIAAL